MASTKNEDLTVNAGNGDVSSAEIPKKTLDLNSTEPDRAEDPPTGAAPDDGSLAVEKNEEGEVSKKTAPTVGSAAEDNSSVSNVQKKIKRAERFGMPVQLSEEEKRNSRAERFGTGTKLQGSEETKKAEELKRKARAERFGLPVSSAPADEDAKKKARIARFGAEPKVDTAEEDKRKARALRFSKPTSGSPLQANGKEKIDQKAAVAEKAV